MNCCGCDSVAEKQFSQKIADRDVRRYKRKGPEDTTRMLLRELRRWPLQGKHLLDVGGGIGVISSELAASDLASTTLVDGSPAYLEAARREVEPRFAPRPSRFFLGDFTQIAEHLDDVDVVTLDRVVCCYPDAEALLRAAAARTRALLGFTYPRNRWYVRISVAVENLIRGWRGSTFRAFVHRPAGMHAVLEAAGLVRVARRETLAWVLDVYRRNGVALHT